MREYPDYEEEDPSYDNETDERWKTDPRYWQAELDYHTAEYDKTERERYAWLDQWWKGHTGDMMGNVDYLQIRIRGECHLTGKLSAQLHLHELGCPEPVRLT